MVSYGTLAVNLIRFLSQLAEAWGAFSAETRALVFIGFLGSSTFGNETMNCFGMGKGTLALWNVGAYISGGLAALGRVEVRFYRGGSGWRNPDR